MRAKYDRGKRRDDASCDVIVRGIIPGSPISRNLLNILEETERSLGKRVIKRVIMQAQRYLP